MPNYFIHNNYEKPYLVIIKDDLAEVYKSNKDNKYEKLYKKYKFIKKYIGKSSGLSKACAHKKEDSKLFNGNTILLQLSLNKFVYIGSKIYEFNIKEKVIKYYSPVGNNDIPYPIILTDKYVYFMLDRQKILLDNIPKNIDYEDAYSYFYNIKDTKIKIKF
jgi:hypothetical protein